MIECKYFISGSRLIHERHCYYHCRNGQIDKKTTAQNSAPRSPPYTENRCCCCCCACFGYENIHIPYDEIYIQNCISLNAGSFGKYGILSESERERESSTALCHSYLYTFPHFHLYMSSIIQMNVSFGFYMKCTSPH